MAAQGGGGALWWFILWLVQHPKSSLFNTLSGIITLLTVVCSYTVYTELPDDANVPMQFGFGGEIGWSMPSKHAFLMYPFLSLMIGIALPLVSKVKKNRSAALKSGASTAAAGASDIRIRPPHLPHCDHHPVWYRPHVCCRRFSGSLRAGRCKGGASAA